MTPNSTPKAAFLPPNSSSWPMQHCCSMISHHNQGTLNQSSAIKHSSKTIVLKHDVHEPNHTEKIILTRFPFCQIANNPSYDALEEWYNALQDANNRKGSAPLPVIVVGSKIDKASSRAVKPSKLEFMKTKQLPYLEISAKGDYKLKELITGVVRALCG